MVDHERQRGRYIGGTEGAPPVPPAGGYRGARRAQAPYAVFGIPAAEVDPDAGAKRPPANAIGWIALVAAILFAVILLGTLLAGGTDVLYGVTMLTLQLVVVAVIIAAIATSRGRLLGASALVVTLLLNVGTVGAMSAVQTSASGSYEGQKTEEQRHEEAYPGVKDTAPDEILSQPSLEGVRAQSEDMLADIRQELTERYGYTWTEAGPEELRPERNGYGGESMLVQYTSVRWMTNEPIQDYERKLEVMGVIEDVIVSHGMYGMYAFNEPSSGLDDSVMENFYGGTAPRTQTSWEWYSDNYPDPLRFYALLHDLSKDETGDFRLEREAESARTGEPLEGLQIFVLAPQLLSEDDRTEFEERLQEYPGF